MECCTGGDLTLGLVLCLLLLTVISKTNEFCYFLCTAANLSEKTQKCVWTWAVTEMQFILVKNWEQMSNKGDNKMVKKLHFIHIKNTMLPLGTSLLLGPCLHNEQSLLE